MYTQWYTRDGRVVHTQGIPGMGEGYPPWVYPTLVYAGIHTLGIYHPMYSRIHPACPLYSRCRPLRGSSSNDAQRGLPRLRFLNINVKEAHRALPAPFPVINVVHLCAELLRFSRENNHNDRIDEGSFPPILPMVHPSAHSGLPSVHPIVVKCAPSDQPPVSLLGLKEPLSLGYSGLLLIRFHL